MARNPPARDLERRESIRGPCHLRKVQSATRVLKVRRARTRVAKVATLSRRKQACRLVPSSFATGQPAREGSPDFACALLEVLSPRSTLRNKRLSPRSKGQQATAHACYQVSLHFFHPSTPQPRSPARSCCASLESPRAQLYANVLLDSTLGFNARDWDGGARGGGGMWEEVGLAPGRCGR